MHSINNSLTPLNATKVEPPTPLSGSKGTGGFSSKPSLIQRLSDTYRNAIQKFVKYLQKQDMFVTSLVLGTLLTEPWQAIKAGLKNPVSWKKHFNFYNLNPATFTKEQLNKQPILLIHGNYHNQSAWMGLAKKLKHSGLGPVYTVNLPNGDITDNDFDILRRKIEQIKIQYKQFGINNIKINVVGHSRGGYLAGRIAWTTLKKDGKRYWERSEDIGKIITLGYVLDKEDISHMEKQDPGFSEHIYHIMGKYDILATEHSLLPANHNEIVNSGHLGVLNSHKAHRQIIQWLS